MKFFLRYKNINLNFQGIFFCFVFVLLLVLSVFHITEAGYSSLFYSTAASKQIIAKSSKDISLNSSLAILPVAAINSDPNPEKVFDTVPIYNGETLVSDLIDNKDLYNDVSSKISTYVVREGDTISIIAKMFDVSENTILWANNINNKSILKVGQTLTILPVTGIKHVVQVGETVSGIASKYRADLIEMYNYNGLDANSKLIAGQIVIIPNAEIGLTRKTVVRALNGMIVPDDPLTVDVRKLPSYPGYYGCPVFGAVVTQGLHGRNSVDLAAPVGTPLKASASGTVVISKSNGTWNGGYGNFVVISHENQTQTLYAHMLRSIVKQGEQVNKGQIIGYIGISGMTTGPHVHFEIRGAQNPFATKNCN